MTVYRKVGIEPDEDGHYDIPDDAIVVQQVPFTKYRRGGESTTADIVECLVPVEEEEDG